MNNFNKELELHKIIIMQSLEHLTQKDEKLNYLYFLRDEINAQIKKVKK